MEHEFDAFAHVPEISYNPMDIPPWEDDLTAADAERAAETDALERSGCTCPDIECVQHRDGGYLLAAF